MSKAQVQAPQKEQDLLRIIEKVDKELNDKSLNAQYEKKFQKALDDRIEEAYYTVHNSDAQSAYTNQTLELKEDKQALSNKCQSAKRHLVILKKKLNISKDNSQEKKFETNMKIFNKLNTFINGKDYITKLNPINQEKQKKQNLIKQQIEEDSKQFQKFLIYQNMIRYQELEKKMKAKENYQSPKKLEDKTNILFELNEKIGKVLDPQEKNKLNQKFNDGIDEKNFYTTLNQELQNDQIHTLSSHINFSDFTSQYKLNTREQLQNKLKELYSNRFYSKKQKRFLLKKESKSLQNFNDMQIEPNQQVSSANKK